MFLLIVNFVLLCDKLSENADGIGVHGVISPDARDGIDGTIVDRLLSANGWVVSPLAMRTRHAVESLTRGKTRVASNPPTRLLYTQYSAGSMAYHP
ncbi:uncharacterized protein ARMOST_21841 [Armillaria ostoyae]|uniref:Uncharacterized protein n=1 Tax=Armillaria ostoyae TaxID=47428 RepID=A0A284SBA3_ARMOS|nr:uncharacterized protein ARMOST_21841 [Armillaria ostoyae]